MPNTGNGKARDRFAGGGWPVLYVLLRLKADRTAQLQTALNGKHSAQRTSCTADLHLARHSSDCYRAPGNLEVANTNAIREGLSASHTWKLLSSGGSGLDILFGRSSLETGMQVLRLHRGRCPHLYRQLCHVGPAPLELPLQAPRCGQPEASGVEK
jgi:hypothetical protein